jgi:hypothetical protein
VSERTRPVGSRKRRRSAATRFTGALLLIAGLGSCTSLRGLYGPSAAEAPDRRPDPEEIIRDASLALDEGRYAEARRLLLPMLPSCLTSSAERRAALLLASAELDPANPHGTPSEAARLAAGVLMDAGAGNPEAPVARTLYLVALDRGAPGGTRISPCAPASGVSPVVLPTSPAPTTQERLTALRSALAARNDTLSARADSLVELRARAAAAERRARELEAELERIRQLLRGGDPTPTPRGPGDR